MQMLNGEHAAEYAAEKKQATTPCSHAMQNSNMINAEK